MSIVRQVSDKGEFCFVHAADLHLDTPFKGLGEVAPDVAKALREASLEAFDALVELCLERAAAFLVLAGDIYDGAERGLRAQLRFLAGLERLSAAKIPVFVAHGNHDPVEEGWSAIRRWPEGVHVFSDKEVECIPVVRGGRAIAAVQGISFDRGAVTENLALRFSRPERGVFSVAVLHCNVVGASEEHDPYSPCTLNDLLEKGICYWALGHIHARSVLAGRPHSDESFVVYPGNLQARSPKPSEQGEKGACVVHVSGGRVAELEHVACDRIRFAELEIDVSACEDLAELSGELGEAAAEALERADGRSLVVKARLSGRGPCHAELAREGALGELLASLRDGPQRRPFFWWDRLIDDTRPGLDLASLLEEGDFASVLLELAEGRARAVGDELFHKMPKDLAQMARELFESEIDPDVLDEEASVTALDVLELTS